MLAIAVLAPAQQTSGAIRGQVTDASGALVPGASLTVTSPDGASRAVSTDGQGAFSINGLAPGTYTIRVTAAGFSPSEKTGINVSGGRTLTLTFPMRLTLARQEVTVQGEANNTVSTEASSNAGQLVLKDKDLDALPDDPDDLSADLQALAGPSAGPNGGQIYIDGFTGGRLPPKQSIREIRINQNPFSSEYDRLGFGRIEILTKPGTDKFRGQVFFNDSNGIFNSRNPYASNKPDFNSRQYGGNVSGPVNRRSSFFMDFERRDINDNAIIKATILDPSLNIVPYSRAVLAPQYRTTISPRIDYQLSPNHTLTGRYEYTRTSLEDAGIGQFSLPERAYGSFTTEHSGRLTETAVLNAKAINETRLRFEQTVLRQNGNNAIPTINVLEAFTGGGSQIGLASNRQTDWELQNYTSLALGAHSVKFGVRVRASTISDYSPQNFGGTFTFAGGIAPALDANGQIVLDASGNPLLEQIDSIERYRRTLLFQQMGKTPAEIRSLGGGATQFSIAGGNPRASVTQVDLGPFVQDDWRLKPNFTLSLGLRYETQTNIHDWSDFAPRLGFAWAPGQRSGGRQPKTVIRGGFGLFYDRFSGSLVLRAIRFNGVNQAQYIVSNPDFYPAVPNIQELAANALPQTIYQVDSSLRAPYTMQAAIGIERQLPFNTTIASTITNSRSRHLLLTRNINAPLPGTYTGAPNSGVRPYGNQNIYNYESSGVLNQTQWFTNVNSRINARISIFSFYVLGYAKSNTDGVTTFPASQYDMRTEYGRSSLDVRHRFVFGGSFSGPFALRLSPFITAHSGAPFNITIGRDLYGQTVYTERPAFATDFSKPGVVSTPFGNFDPNPEPGEEIIPRNYGEGPANVAVNLRMSRTWGFGAIQGGRSDFSGAHGGGGRGAMRMGGGPGHGMHGVFSDALTEHRYNLTFSVSARNLLNTLNPGTPIGNLTSPFFGQSNTIAGGWGPVALANNRRVELQLRFSF